jgi:hypothetical protein
MSPLVRSLVVITILPTLALSALATTDSDAIPPIQRPSEPKGGDTGSPGATPVPTPPPSPVKSEKKLSPSELYAKEFKDCMDAWDAGTNMTKSNWRQVCHRNLKMRLPYKAKVRGYE